MKGPFVIDESVVQRRITAEEAVEIQQGFMVKVYGWMFAGLMLTAIVSLVVLETPVLLEMIFSSKIVFFGLMILQLGLVVWLSARIQHMSASTATMIFLGYAALTGLTLSAIFLAYTAASLASTFFVAGGMFAATGAYGYLTKRDLTGFGSFLFMGLIGMVLASIVNIFLNNSTIYWITTYIGIFIFVGLTAYDTQKIKTMSLASLQGSDTEQRAAVMGALTLYLDFINLFLLLLRVMGRRK